MLTAPKKSLLGATAGPMSTRLARPPYVDRFQYRVGSALTPQLVTTLLRQADLGYMFQLVDLLEELRETDPHLHAELFKRESQVAGSEWEIRAPENTGEVGATVADYCTRVLSELESRTDTTLAFTDALMHLMTGVYNGRAAIEAVWSEDGRQLDSLEYIHTRRLAYATDWRLHLWDATGGGSESIEPVHQPGLDMWTRFPGVALDRFPRGKFIIHRPRIRGGYPTREGVGRVVCWYVLFKKWNIRDILAFAEWGGRGLRIGTFAAGGNKDNPARATDDDVQALEDALVAMSSATETVIPDTTKIDIHSAPTDNSVHQRLQLICNAEISKAILGATLTTEVGESGGNRALGEVHDEVRLAIARYDAKSLAATLRRDLLGPMVERRFGPGMPVPSIAFAVDPKADLDGVANRLSLLIAAGVQVGQRTARELTQIPDPEADDTIVVPPSKGGGV